MGQNNSKVVVHVQLDAAYYYAGDTVTGAVVLHLEQPIQVNAVEAKVTGVEKTKWVERTGKSDTTYHGKQVIFKEKLPLKGSGTINAGDYQWPISFQLPANIPGTFHYTSDKYGHNSKASIEYKVKVLVDQEGMFKSDFKKTVRFDVLQRSKVQAPSNPLQLQTDAPISAWCCINKGHIGMQVATDTDSFLPGDAINISAQVDNNSSTDVTCVEMKLHQRLHLMSDGFLGTSNKHIDVVHALIRQQPVKGSKGAAGLLLQYAGSLQLDRALEATCMGKIIKSTYELEVRAKTGCCLSEASVRQPVFINDPQPHAAPALMQPPLGWAPQVYPAVTFQVPAPDCYATWQQQQQQPLPQQEYTAAAPQQAEYQQQYGQQYPQQQQQYQQQYQPPVQAYSPPGYAAYADPSPSAAVPGAVCYVGSPQQQQQQQQYKAAGGGGAGGSYDAAAMQTAPAWPDQSY